jgi:hypothetical protein
VNKTRYIIPFKYNGDVRRLLNLETLKKHIKLNFPNLDLCVVEQGESQIIKDSLFLYNPKKFNKSWSLNVAVKKAIEEGFQNVILGDSDLICNKITIEKSIENLKEYDAISPFHQNVTYLNKNQSTEFILNLDFNSLISLPEFKEKRATIIPLAGGVICFKTETYKLIGGYPENFEGWGGEDDLVSFKIGKCLKYGVMKNARAFHLYHDDPTVTAELNYHLKGLAIRSFSKEDILKKSEEEWDSLGNPDLYKGDTK